jgi:hypothetical protein
VGWGALLRFLRASSMSTGLVLTPAHAPGAVNDQLAVPCCTVDSGLRRLWPWPHYNLCFTIGDGSALEVYSGLPRLHDPGVHLLFVPGGTSLCATLCISTAR